MKNFAWIFILSGLFGLGFYGIALTGNLMGACDALPITILGSSVLVFIVGMKLEPKVL